MWGTGRGVGWLGGVLQDAWARVTHCQLDSEWVLETFKGANGPDVVT